MEYRNIKYREDKWTAYNGQKAQCYTCNDKKLLNELGLLGISESTESGLLDSIDYYLDNREDLLAKRDRERQVASLFYDTLTYKGD